MIRVRDLTCGYPGRRVLDGLSLDVGAGEFVGILGPNGAGKTTLLMALSGIVHARSGSIEVLGTALHAMTSRARARSMAVVTQESEARLPFSCAEIVRMGRYPHRKRWQMETVEDREAVTRAILLTDTGDLADRPVTEVSGGERQRVMMARALAQSTPLLLLDEATSAMDVRHKLKLFGLLERLNRDEALTVLTVLHDVNLAAFFCKRLVFLKNGSVRADGPPEEVLTERVLEEVYETRALIQDIPGTGKRQVVFLPHGHPSEEFSSCD